jgi:hypothetical protein
MISDHDNLFFSLRNHDIERQKNVNYGLIRAVVSKMDKKINDESCSVNNSYSQLVRISSVQLIDFANFYSLF